jgi:hypothetical protein
MLHKSQRIIIMMRWNKFHERRSNKLKKSSNREAFKILIKADEMYNIIIYLIFIGSRAVSSSISIAVIIYWKKIIIATNDALQNK